MVLLGTCCLLVFSWLCCSSTGSSSARAGCWPCAPAVDVAAVLELRYSRPVDLASLAASIQLVPDVPLSATADGATVRLRLSQPYRASGPLVVHLGGRDQQGQPLRQVRLQWDPRPLLLGLVSSPPGTTTGVGLAQWYVAAHHPMGERHQQCTAPGGWTGRCLCRGGGSPSARRTGLWRWNNPVWCCATSPQRSRRPRHHGPCQVPQPSTATSVAATRACCCSRASAVPSWSNPPTTDRFCRSSTPAGPGDWGGWGDKINPGER